MRKILLTLCFAGLAFAADSQPRIRAVTVFIDVDSNNYAAKIQDAQKFLAAAKAAFNRAGFEGAGGRITTQPFPVFTHDLSRQEALGLIRKMREAASKGSSALDIGPAMMHDNDDTGPVALLTDVLS